MRGKRWIVRGALAVVVAATSAIGMTNGRAGAGGNGYDATYTTDAEFDLGTLSNVNHTAQNDQVQVNATAPAIWVANSGEDSVSRIDTSLNTEVARYPTWFDLPDHTAEEGPSPSRTAVAANGDAYVLNRGYAISTITGARSATLMKIKGSGFIDRNENGIEDTSRDTNNDGVIQPSEMMPMGPDLNSNGYPDADGEISEITDERIEWIVPLSFTSGIGNSLCIAPNGHVWVGLYAHKEYWEVSPAGEVQDQSPVGVWIDSDSGPYGCVIDSAGILYGASFGDYVILVNTNGKFIQAVSPHGGQNSGITYHNGLAYVSMLSGPTMYKTFNGTTLAFADGGQPDPGITAAVTSGGSGETIVFPGRQNGVIYKETTVGSSWSAGPNNVDASGIILDSDGHVWRIHKSGNAVVKYHKDTGAVLHTQPVGRLPDSYSDTARLTAIPSTPVGRWIVTQDSGGADTVWDTVRWNQEPEGAVPEGATIVVKIRAANTLAALGAATPVTFTGSGEPLGGAVVGQFAEVIVELTANASQQSPVLSDVRVTALSSNQAPTVNCSDVNLVTSPDACSAPSTSIGTASDPDGDTLTVTQAPVGPYGLGPTDVTLTARDPSGAEASCSAVVNVTDNVPPSITCPAPTRLECAGRGRGTFFSPLPATGADNCSVTFSNPAAGLFPLGSTTLHYSATDGSGNSNACTSAIAIVDTKPPVIASVVPSKSILWPPNHKMVPVDVATASSDVCDGGASCRIVSVTSNEPVSGPGAGYTTPDWIIVDRDTVKLRAERLGGGSGHDRGHPGRDRVGRIYTVTVNCVDRSGKTSAKTTNVSVPHHRPGGGSDDDGCDDRDHNRDGIHDDDDHRARRDKNNGKKR